MSLSVRAAALALVVALAGCEVSTGPTSGPAPAPVPTARTDSGPQLSRQQAAAMFEDVVRVVEPVAERECRARQPRLNCDFRIVVDTRPGQPANAFQTIQNGRPVVGFTLALIQDARNRDEIAFVMGHEAAHHIRGHIASTQSNAQIGGVAAGILASVVGLDASGAEAASRIGATVNARRYSKNYELEADELGTIITARAGFNPVRGAGFFQRLPDPGDRFLGSHPPNGDRIAVVQRTAARL